MKRSIERGFTLVEIMIVVAIIALLAAIAIPNVLRGRTTANESAAIGNLRALISSLEMYRSVYQAYPTDWDNHMYGTNCTTAAPDPDFGPPSFCKDLASQQTVQGFKYDYASAAGTGTYDIRAVPATGSDGTRSFLANETGLIRHCSGLTASTVQLDDEATIDATPDACD